jgi:hypothetical protein
MQIGMPPSPCLALLHSICSTAIGKASPQEQSIVFSSKHRGVQISSRLSHFSAHACGWTAAPLTVLFSTVSSVRSLGQRYALNGKVGIQGMHCRCCEGLPALGSVEHDCRVAGILHPAQGSRAAQPHQQPLVSTDTHLHILEEVKMLTYV